ncbi:MAG TPA: hypothetical protein VH599_09420 [Ktedonobacterales bacterium]|jgi:hypothetical protein
MLNKARLIQLGLWIGLVGVILAALGWGAFQPWAANHFGYALPGPDRLPNRISYNGRYYGNPNECAGDTWCQPSDKSCATKQQLVELRLWPLKQVGVIPTLFGPPHPIFAPPDSGQTFLLVLDDANCYLIYGLMDGP